MGAASDAWVVFRLEVASEAEDAVASFLADEGVPGVVTAVWELDRDDGPPPGRTRLEAHVAAADAPRLAGALARYLDSLAALDPALGGARLEQRPSPHVDWDALFRHHHRPVVVGSRLVIAPPWDVPAAPGRIVLTVDPGMAFGTGQHGTTRTCLEEIEALAGAGGVRSALDVGTGSGVLAAALVRLGVPAVVAVDVDPAVLPIARATLDTNGAAAAVRLAAATAAAVRGCFDLVVANLLADALVADAADLARLVAPGGRLVVSGLLGSQVAQVTSAYPGWRTTAVRADGEWRTLRLERA